MNMDRSGKETPNVPNANVEAKVKGTLEEFEELVADLAMPNYHFRLYVSGNTSRSATAIANVRRICEEYLPNHYELEVIDIYQQPKETKAAEVVVVPTLIKELPLPIQRFVGDMSKAEKIVVGLRLGR